MSLCFRFQISKTLHPVTPTQKDQKNKNNSNKQNKRQKPPPPKKNKKEVKRIIELKFDLSYTSQNVLRLTQSDAFLIQI